jgi:hypothetical protein
LEVKVAGLEQTEIERLRYWQGQMLRSRDFRDSARTENQMRYWHNRALHNAYGVSFGLQIAEIRKNPTDPKSLIAVSVSRGVAYDCFGRELIVSNTRQVTIPPAPKDDPRLPQPKKLVLIMRYRDTATGCCSAGDLGGVCWPVENRPGIEPEFVWTRIEYGKTTEGVPLARVIYDNSGAVQLDDKFIPPKARPLARPFLASGETIPGNTPWEVWRVRTPKRVTVAVGMQTRIDTSTAGFTETPSYFAWLEGLWVEETGTYHPLFFTGITEASADGFIFRLLMPPLDRPRGEAFNEGFEVNFPILARRKNLYVCWLGSQAQRPVTGGTS